MKQKVANVFKKFGAVISENKCKDSFFGNKKMHSEKLLTMTIFSLSSHLAISRVSNDNISF